MLEFEDIEKARSLLGLAQESTLDEIKTAFRERIKEVHPDVASGRVDHDSSEEAEEHIWAYETLLAYTSQYPFSFSLEQFKKVRRRDPTWAVNRFFSGMKRK